MNGVVSVDDNELDITGMSDAWATAVEVRLPDGGTIRCASLAGMVALKLIAWRNRGSFGDNKDATDFARLLRSSSQGVFEDECWSDEEALEANGYVVDMAGAFRIERELQATFDPTTVVELEAILSEAHEERLTRAMSPLGPSPADLITALRRGVRARDL